MIFINQHVCVFLTATELSEEKQKEFFYRMCTALQYDLQKMKSLSVIYACYGLFGGSPLTDTDLKKLSRLAPCENCEKLLKKSLYKAFPIKENACSMCIFSNSYLNAREKEERIALKHFMMPGKKYEYLQLLPENAFTSVFRLESDYTLGNIPTIPFHRYLYQYLENNPYIENEENTFFDGLLHYMKSNMDTLIDLDKYKPQLTTYFNNIIKLDEKSVTDDIYEDAAAHLKLPYVYQTPLKPAKPVIAGSPDRKKKKRQMRKKEQTDYDIMSLGLFARDSEESVEEKASQEEPVNMTAGMDGLYTLNLHDMFFPDDNSSPSKKVDVLLPERASNDVSDKISDESPDNILNNAKDIYFSDSEQKDTSSAYAIPPCIHSGPEESYEPSSRKTTAREEIVTEESVPSDTIMEESASLSCKEENKIETNTTFASLSSVPTETPTDTPAEDDMAEFDFFDNPFDDFDDNFSIEAEDGDPGFPSISGIDDKITASQNVSNKGQEFSENTLNSNTVITTDNSTDIVMTTNSDKNTVSDAENDLQLSFKLRTYTDIYSIQSFSDTFDKRIHIVSRNETFQFLADFLNASSIAIESAIYHERCGFLLYLNGNNKFYFYDLKVFGTDMLLSFIREYISIVITCHPMQILALLQDTVNGELNTMHSLDCLYWIDNSHAEPDAVKLFGENPTYDRIMPRYTELFDQLYNSVSSKKLLSEYQDTLKTFRILSQCLTYKKVFSNHKLGMLMDSYMHIDFTFNWSETFLKAGILYRVELPDMGDSYYISSNMCTKICHCFQGLHHNSAHHFQLLSITKKAIYWYYEGTQQQAFRFYDSMMSRLQKVYEREKKQALNSQTLCVYYQ